MVIEGQGRRDMGDTSGALQTLLLSGEDIEVFLQEVAELAADVVTPAASCGITTTRDGQYLTVASSDERAATVDETQYERHEGPCLHAFETGQVVDMPDVAVDTRWPRYSEHAKEMGLLSSVTTPLIVRGSTVGALNIYSFDTTHAFNDLEHQRLEVFAAQASAALALALRQAKSDATNAQLEQALASRTIIDQALGILMGQQRCSAEDAFVLLRTHSQNNNRKLRDVAADLIARTSGQDPQDAPRFQ